MVATISVIILVILALVLLYRKSKQEIKKGIKTPDTVSPPNPSNIYEGGIDEATTVDEVDDIAKPSKPTAPKKSAKSASSKAVKRKRETKE